MNMDDYIGQCISQLSDTNIQTSNQLPKKWHQKTSSEHHHPVQATNPPMWLEIVQFSPIRTRPQPHSPILWYPKDPQKVHLSTTNNIPVQFCINPNRKVYRPRSPATSSIMSRLPSQLHSLIFAFAKPLSTRWCHSRHTGCQQSLSINSTDAWSRVWRNDPT